jgi:hypothetical protein
VNRILEFILRMRDEASGALAAAKARLRETGEAGRAAKPGLDGAAGGLAKMVEPANNARAALMRVVGVLGIVAAAFKAGEILGERLFRWAGFGTDEALKRAKELSARAESAARQAAEAAREEKDALAGITSEYERQARGLDEVLRKEEALAAARAKAGMERRAARDMRTDADERVALSQGYDPEAVRLMYADERRRQAAEDRVADAEALAASAARQLAAAEEQQAAAVARSMAIEERARQAEERAAAARRELGELDGLWLSEKEKEARTRRLLMEERRAQVALDMAGRERGAAGEAESLAADAAAVAREQAAAAQEAMRTALLGREKAEFDYQADVREFWQARDADDARRAEEAMEAVRRQTEERRRLEEAADREAHLRRIDDARAEVRAGEEAQAQAADRLARAQAGARQAWGWYRDPDSFARQLAEEKADAEASRRFEKDAQRLTRRADWRTRELGAGDEAVRRVVLAREEERAAADALRHIAENTAGVKEMLQTLLTTR